MLISKKWFAGVGAALVLGAFIATPVAAQTTLKMAYALSTDSHYGAGTQAFADYLKAHDADFDIKQYPNSQLGGEREVIEGLQLGSIDMAITSTGAILNFVPDVGVFDIPFLFRDLEHARHVMDSDIGQDMLKKFPAHGLVALDWGEQGFRHLTNSKRLVKEPADIKGLKIRTTENPIHIKAFRELGVLATPMAWPEVATALQQHTIDGQENPLSVIVSTKMWQLQKYLSLTGHVYAPALVMISPSAYNKMSDQDKELLAKASKASVKAMRDYVDTVEKQGVETAKEHGMEVNEVDHDAFVEAVQPLYKHYYSKFGEDLIKDIQNTK